MEGQDLKTTIIEQTEEIKNIPEHYTITPEFLVFLYVALIIGAFGGVASYMSKVYNKKRFFNFLDFIASLIAGAFGGLLGAGVAYYLDIDDEIFRSALYGIMGALSMAILKSISEHEGDILKRIFNFIFRK